MRRIVGAMHRIAPTIRRNVFGICRGVAQRLRSSRQVQAAQTGIRGHSNAGRLASDVATAQNSGVILHEVVSNVRQHLEFHLVQIQPDLTTVNRINDIGR